MAVGCCSQYFSGHHSPPLELPSDWKSQQILFWVRALIRCRRVCLTKGWHSHEYIIKNTGQMELSIRSSPEKEAQKITELLSCLRSSPSNIPTLLSHHFPPLQALSIAMQNLTWTSFPPHSIFAPQQLGGRWQTRGNGAVWCMEKLGKESQMSTD